MSGSEEREKSSLGCTCLGDGFGALPPELRPREKRNSSLRKVTCPGCGMVYRTNRETDLCMTCAKKQGLGS